MAEPPLGDTGRTRSQRLAAVDAPAGHRNGHGTPRQLAIRSSPAYRRGASCLPAPLGGPFREGAGAGRVRSALGLGRQAKVPADLPSQGVFQLGMAGDGGRRPGGGIEVDVMLLPVADEAPLALEAADELSPPHTGSCTRLRRAGRRQRLPPLRASRAAITSRYASAMFSERLALTVDARHLDEAPDVPTLVQPVLQGEMRHGSSVDSPQGPPGPAGPGYIVTGCNHAQK